MHCAAGSASTEGMGRGEVGGFMHLQGAVHMVAARLGCERVMVGTGLATSFPECMDGLTKHYSRHVGS